MIPYFLNYSGMGALVQVALGGATAEALHPKAYARNTYSLDGKRISVRLIILVHAWTLAPTRRLLRLLQICRY